MDAAVPLSPCLVSKVCSNTCLCASCSWKYAHSAYSLQSQTNYCHLDLWNKAKLFNRDQEVKEGLWALRLLSWSATPLDSPVALFPKRRHRKQCERKRKRGKCGGIRSRLAASLHRLINTVPHSGQYTLTVQLNGTHTAPEICHDVKDCCVFIFTESWVNDNIPDSTIQLAGLTCCHAN